MKYQLKPIEAQQWPGHYTPEFKTFLGENLKESEPREGIGVVGYMVLTYKGKQWLHRGDYVAKDREGNFHHFLTDMSLKKYMRKLTKYLEL